jgi:hypothetical protein
VPVYTGRGTAFLVGKGRSGARFPTAGWQREKGYIQHKRTGKRLSGWQEGQSAPNKLLAAAIVPTTIKTSGRTSR